MSNILTPGLMPDSLTGIQAAFNAGDASSKAAFQASVSGDAARTVTITVPAGKVSANIAMPVLIDGRTLPAAWWAHVATGGVNIRATVGGAGVPVDVTYCDSRLKEADIWVRVPVKAAAAVSVVLTCTAATGIPAVTHPLGRNAVWAMFDRVFAGGKLDDRTGKGTALTASGRQTFNVVARSPNLSNVHQGVVYDALRDRYLAVDTTVIYQYSSDFVLTGVTKQLADIGATGTNHFGQGVCVDGVLYLPCEFWNAGVFNSQKLAALDSATLDVLWVVDVSAQGHEMAAIAYRPEDGYLYVGSYADGTKLWRYTLAGTYVSALTLSATLTNIQGLTYFGGKFYAANEQPITALREIDPTTGAVAAGYPFHLVTPAAPEGLTVVPGGIGLLHDTSVGSYLLTLAPIDKRNFEGNLSAGAAASAGSAVNKYLTSSLPSLTSQTFTLVAMHRNVHNDRRHQCVMALDTQGATVSTNRVGLSLRNGTKTIAGWDGSNGWIDSLKPVGVEETNVLQLAYTPTTRKICGSGTIVSGSIASARPIAGNTMELRLMYENDTGGETAAGQCDIAAIVTSYLPDSTMRALDASWRNPASFYTVT